MVNSGIIKKHWAKFWGQYHKDGINICIICGHPAYKRWEKRYNGYRGFCTNCNSDWAES